MRVVLVDLLCWSSAFKLARSARSLAVEKIYYVNHGRSFGPFIALFARVLGKPIVQADQVIDSHPYRQGQSLYEFVQISLNDFLEKWAERASVVNFVKEYSRKHQLNRDKLKAHLQETVYPLFYRPFQLMAWAEKMGPYGSVVVMLHQTMVSSLIQDHFKERAIIFFRPWVMWPTGIPNRPDYIYDLYLNKKYFSGRFFELFRFCYEWFRVVLGGFLVGFIGRGTPETETCIGLELSQHRVRKDEINDIAWMEELGADCRRVRAIQFSQFDQESYQVLREKVVAYYSLADKPDMIFKRRFRLVPNDGSRWVGTDYRYFLKTASIVFAGLQNLSGRDEQHWLEFQSRKYLCRVMFWETIYRFLGIKVLWTMFDVDEDKLAKVQAIEWCGGLSAAGHWSNFPMYKIDNRKCTDVLMTWGEHFLRNNFSHYSFKAIFLVGYICDYYFESHRAKAQKLKEQYKDQFVLSYHDNIMGHDIAYSQEMQIEVHQMLISLLKKFDHLIIFLKPKRKYVMDKIVQELPELERYIAEKRIVIFTGETAKLKANPAMIGMASDLVVGLGVSTSAAEAYFAGTVAFHADLTGFERNEFANRGLGAIVFRDIFNLEKAIMDRISGNNQWTHEDYRGYYNALDPFQDGWAARRTGFILKRIRHYLADGVGRDEVLQKVSRDYDVYLSVLPQLQKVSQIKN